jgi:acetylornithine deacetylase/succinyl-diaminopimelate desuccinylase family protein
MTTLEILKKLISIQSNSQISNKKVVDFIVSLFPNKDICKITPLKKGDLDLFNLEVRIKGESNKNPIVFSGHTDTVPSSSKWTKNPFEPVIENNLLYGLGSSDMKAGVACMINTALSVNFKPKNDIVFLFDADEEAGSVGGKDFIQNVNITPGSAKVVICEPTACQLEIGQKGVIEFHVTFYGKALHSSRTSYDKNLENNAIHKAFQAFKDLEQYEKTLEANKDELFDIPTQAICQINGGTATNVIPDQCKFVINRRVLPNEDMEQVAAKTIKIIQEVDSSANVEITFKGEPNLIEKSSELYQQAEFISNEVIGSSKVRVTSGWTQAGLFKKWGDCLIWGPGDMTMAHQADEYCPIDDLEQMEACYKKLIELNQ